VSWVPDKRCALSGMTTVGVPEDEGTTEKPSALLTSSQTRLGLFYVVSYLGTGVSLPFISTYFRSRGLSGAEIGVILAVPLLARPFLGPVLAVWADGFTLRRTPLVLLALGRRPATWPCWPRRASGDCWSAGWSA
jgi:MFS family permease